MAKARFGNFHMPLPASRALRIALGVVLVIFGFLGFLPILGFWMIPLGLIVLSVDLPLVRRWRRQLTVWWHRRKGDAPDRSSPEVTAPSPADRGAQAAERVTGAKG